MRPSRNDLLVQALGAVLKERRNELTMTQEGLAAAAELDRPYITMMEAGKKQPSVSVFWRLAAGVQLSAVELAARVDEKLAALQAVARRAGKKAAPSRETSPRTSSSS
ncbi:MULTISPECIES: helix-turn-helix domain-containing protein [unclassified Rhizobacter]|uniref:helix-turn-helix domain-containing protein n=2 Tax=Rhizobacter TaxID=212743 RepID=UPI0009E8AD6E|nr:MULTISPECIES: helix-turn-helix transcriptional regulator [unclassified Rhizobacter]